MNKITTIVTRQWKFLLAFNLFVILATGWALATAKPVWMASAQLILPKTNSKLDANLGTLGSLKNGEVGFSTEVNPLNVQASIITSDALLERVLALDPEKNKFKSVSGYKKIFTVKPAEQSTIMSLTVTGSSPELALQRAIVLTETYQKRLNELRQANSRARQQYNKQELEQARLKLTFAQNNLTNFKKDNGIVNDEEQTKGIVSTINSLISLKAQTLASAKANENRVKVLSKRLSMAPSSAVQSLSLGENLNYQVVRQRLLDVETSLRQKQSLFTNEHPEIKTLLLQRAQLQRTLQQYVTQVASGTKVDTTVAPNVQGRTPLIQQLILAESEANALREQAQQLDYQISQLKTTLQSVPENQAKLSEFKRQVDVAAGVYNGLLAQIQQNNIDAFDAYPNVQVLDPPQVEPKPISPKRMLMMINAVLASVVGSIALVLFLESRNPLLSPKDLQARKFALVQTIPRIKHSATKFELVDETEVEFQRLASAISLQPLHNHRLLITSAIVGEGKTTVSIGLAYALVDLGFRVLLVDGDFRKAELSQRLGYIQGATTGQLQISIQSNLDLLPGLPKKGKIMEMLKRGAFEQALATCEHTGNYDYVIVDSAPVSLTSETALMATIISNVLFVIRPNNSYRNSVSDSFAQLNQHNVQIFGLVLNGVESKTKPYPKSSHASVTNS
ncbi:AAA family ATPase [Scytonema sp. UIC 10036]|uniref:exopolysaccharide transport family protein n=1 Tax=Scytonema sp. UIC 10036 TaxID=2304196 RepID=UPI0012DAD401|nr:tyrosine-protein kinase domain-containing protein [Scytonema sp. UIC 10036]MUG96116.1 AAA family ATPase [Scytonema sp. UIC 10036]